MDRGPHSQAPNPGRLRAPGQAVSSHVLAITKAPCRLYALEDAVLTDDGSGNASDTSRHAQLNHIGPPVCHAQGCRSDTLVTLGAVSPIPGKS